MCKYGILESLRPPKNDRRYDTATTQPPVHAFTIFNRVTTKRAAHQCDCERGRKPFIPSL